LAQGVLQAEPARLIHLAVWLVLPLAYQVANPVGDCFHPAAHRIGDFGDRQAQAGANRRLFIGFADRADRQILPGLQLALRQRPVVVAGPVHQQHLWTGGGVAQRHGASGNDPFD